jgi:hypothetical protein
MGRVLAGVSIAAPPALAAPGERCWSGVPGAKTCFERRLEFMHRAIVRPVVHAPIQSSEERLGQVQPGAVGGRVAQRDAITALRRCCPGADSARFSQLRDGCSGCPGWRIACRWAAGWPTRGPTLAAGRRAPFPSGDSAAAPRRRGRRVGAAGPGVGACPGCGGRSSAGTEVDRGAANCVRDAGSAGAGRARRSTPPDVDWWDPSAWHRRPRSPPFFRELWIRAGTERAIGLPTQPSFHEEAPDRRRVDVLQAGFAP